MEEKLVSGVVFIWTLSRVFLACISLSQVKPTRILGNDFSPEKISEAKAYTKIIVELHPDLASKSNVKNKLLRNKINKKNQ